MKREPFDGAVFCTLRGETRIPDHPVPVRQGRTVRRGLMKDENRLYPMFACATHQ